MNILISNDDGIEAVGLLTLAERLSSEHAIFVVAPDREQSASSHSLTLKRPLTVREIKENYYSVDGTPADCVNLAVNGILKKSPDIVISGINHGANLGDDILYSGTVSAAMEGLLLKIPSISVSFEMKRSIDFFPAADFVATLISFLKKTGIPNDTVLNINVPDEITKENPSYKITHQGKRIYDNAIFKSASTGKERIYTIGAQGIRFETDSESDFNAVIKGFVSITPLHLDMTNYASFEELHLWKL